MNHDFIKIVEQNANFSSPLSMIVVAGTLALVPIMLLCLTSYIKISIVLNIVKNGFGVQQLPSAAITAVISLILTIYSMLPQINQTMFDYNEMTKAQTKNEKVSFNETFTALLKLKKPWIDFLDKNSGQEEKKFFLSKLKLQEDSNMQVSKIEESNLFSLVPAFMLSQLKESFALGLILYLPLLLVDILVANVLVSLGLSMVSPSTITLPLKLLLFVASDAWMLISKSILGSFR